MTLEVLSTTMGTKFQTPLEYLREEPVKLGCQLKTHKQQIHRLPSISAVGLPLSSRHVAGHLDPGVLIDAFVHSLEIVLSLWMSNSGWAPGQQASLP